MIDFLAPRRFDTELDRRCACMFWITGALVRLQQLGFLQQGKRFPLELVDLDGLQHWQRLDASGFRPTDHDIVEICGNVFGNVDRLPKIVTLLAAFATNRKALLKRAPIKLTMYLAN